MADLPRLNPVIGVMEKGQIPFTAFCPPDPNAAMAFANSKYDGIVVEGEHNPWDTQKIRDTFQYMLDPKHIAAAGSVAPKTAPMVRVPVNGIEKGQWHAKQALDMGAYGIVWPHISSLEEAYNAVAACRYPRLKDKPNYEPQGIRGDGPARAVRYWGVSQQDYYERADVWPLAPDGEILVIIQIEDTHGIASLDDMLKNVPGIGVVLIGEGDLGQELGFPRQYDHPALLEAMKEIVAICKANNVACGHPHVSAANVEKVLEDGYTFLMTAPVRSTPGLDKGLELTGRA